MKQNKNEIRFDGWATNKSRIRAKALKKWNIQQWTKNYKGHSTHAQINKTLFRSHFSSLSLDKKRFFFLFLLTIKIHFIRMFFRCCFIVDECVFLLVQAQKCEYHLYACSSLNAINYLLSVRTVFSLGSCCVQIEGRSFNRNRCDAQNFISSWIQVNAWKNRLQKYVTLRSTRKRKQLSWSMLESQNWSIFINFFTAKFTAPLFMYDRLKQFSFFAGYDRW